MRAVGRATLLLLVLLAGCLGGGKGDDGGVSQDPEASTTQGPGTSWSGTGGPGTGSGTPTSGRPGAPDDNGTTPPPRPADVSFSGGRMDLAFRGAGAVREAILESTIDFTVHAAPAGTDATTALAMVPQTAADASCEAAGPELLLTSGLDWLDAQGLGPRPAGRYRIVYQAPSGSSIGLLIGDVTQDQVPVEVEGRPGNATIEVREATWSDPAPTETFEATASFAAHGRFAVAAGSRMDYTAAAGDLEARNSVAVKGVQCLEGSRARPADQPGVPFVATSIQHSIAVVGREGAATWEGSLSGAYAGPEPHGGLLIVRFQDGYGPVVALGEDG